MHLGGAVLVVAALVAAETASGHVFVWWPVRVVTVAAGGIAVVFAAAAIAGLVAAEIRMRPDAVRSSLRGYSRLRSLHTGFWFVVSLSAVILVQWPQWIERELHQLVLVDELIILLPVVVPMFFSHAVFFEVDSAAARAFCGGPVAHGCRNRWSYAWWFARHEFGLVLLPLMIVFLVHDLAASQGLAANSGVWIITALSLLALLAAFPLMLRHVWPCEPLPHDALHKAVVRQCRVTGQAAVRFFKWNTGGRIVNAVVTGTLPGTHCVLLSDALLKHFSHEEILAVVRHELVHARRHHVLLRIAAMVVPLAVCYAVGGHDAAMAACEHLAAFRPSGGELVLVSVIAICLAVYARWVFGPFSKLLELEADLMGCREPGDAAFADSALCKLGHVYGFDQQSWLHPTIGLRRRVLRAAHRRQSLRRRLLARVRRWKRGVVLALVAAFLCCL